MNEALLFLFGLVVTLCAIGPLIIAAITEIRERDGRP
jgi:hypothetical protein